MADSRKRRRSDEKSQGPHPVPHTRTSAACDACRVSKTRCDAARPRCGKCIKRGRACVYPDKDPSSIFEEWGTKILGAIENQGRLLSTIAQNSNSSNRPPPSDHSSTFSALGEDSLETMSRKDVPWTPITGSDKILEWAIFPHDKPVYTLPAEAYVAKPNPYALDSIHPTVSRMYELRDIYRARIEPKWPVIGIEQLDGYVENVIANGFQHSASSCMVLLVFALGAIWGNYPDDERRLVYDGTRETYTMALPDDRLKESHTFFAMAQRILITASLDDSLLGVACYCLTGTFFQYICEPIQCWKMFRTASMLWETYYTKRARETTPISKQDESLEAQLFWTCIKIECEMRYELPDLPVCTLQESSFPVSLPSFPLHDEASRSVNGTQHGSPAGEPAPASHFHFMAEISLRRLLNRARHASTSLSPSIRSDEAHRIAETLYQLEDQLQQWLECLPPALQFNIPPDSWPAADEPELVKLTRERYVEVRELLCRVFLYMSLHGGSRLTDTQAKLYGARASYGLRLSIYRIQTEKPFFRHAGSWIACRVRFNQALCLVAAARGRQLGIESSAYVMVPAMWRECVESVRDRLETWGDQGAGIGELAVLLNWLLSQ